jgi:hypothetical protein
MSCIVKKPMRGDLSTERSRLKGRDPRRGKKAERGSAFEAG